MGIISYVLHCTQYTVHCTLMCVTVLHCFCRGGELKTLVKVQGLRSSSLVLCK